MKFQQSLFFVIVQTKYNKRDNKQFQSQVQTNSQSKYELSHYNNSNKLNANVFNLNLLRYKIMF